MKFLVLAQGDPVGKDQLKRLTMARYGPSPPGLETLRVSFQGRSRAKLGPFNLWARIDATATYLFPRQFKWAFKIRLLGFLRSSFTTSFDGETVYNEHGIRVETSTDEVQVESALQRAWAETVFFISPLLADDAIRVASIDGRAFMAYAPDPLAGSVIVRLREDDTMAEIEAERIDPDDGLRKRQVIRMGGGLAQFDGLILPRTVLRYWDDVLFMELSPVSAELNPALEPDEFVLGEDDADDGGTDETET